MADRAIVAAVSRNAIFEKLGQDVNLLADRKIIWGVVIISSIGLLAPAIALRSARLTRSWTAGVLHAAPAISFFTVFLYPVYYKHLTLTLWSVVIAMIVDFAVFYMSRIHQLRPLTIADLQRTSTLSRRVLVPPPCKDDPIVDWGQDALSRSALVDALKVQVLIGNAPVIALRGHFGEGKTSVLNLLRLDIEDHAIVVTFSSWLPGSEETLIRELIQDIGRECRGRYYVPGLRKALVRYAKVFSAEIPYLKSIKDLFETPTQRQELQDLKSLLARLPVRIVVLLDEIDRLQKREIRTVLKVLRGTSDIPNLSFICAFDREQVEKTVCKTFDQASHAYFEKFFPVAIDLPPAPQSVLKNKLVNALDRSQEETL